MHIFIDTNIFLDFYHFSNDQLKELGNLLNLSMAGASTVYLTQQVCDEFSRNRERKILDAMKRFTDSKVKLAIPAFMREYQNAEQMVLLSKDLIQKSDELRRLVMSDISNRTLRADYVIADFMRRLRVIPVTPNDYQEALQRAELGNPPGKPGSVGDSINWTLLLNRVPDGETLHLISKDGDFFSLIGDDKPMSFLADEWNQKKSGSLFVYRSLAKFLAENDFYFDGFEQLLLNDDLYEIGNELVNSDEIICGLIATSNACGYSCDEAEVVRAKKTDQDLIEFEGYLSLFAEGQRRDELPWLGDTIRVEISGKYLRDNEGSWTIEDVSIVSAELNDDRSGVVDQDLF